MHMGQNTNFFNLLPQSIPFQITKTNSGRILLGEKRGEENKTLAFLSGVLPPTGPYGIAAFKGKDKFRRYVSSMEELVTQARKFTEEEKNVFFTVASFKVSGKDIRQTADNIAALKAFRLDID